MSDEATLPVATVVTATAVPAAAAPAFVFGSTPPAAPAAAAAAAPATTAAAEEEVGLADLLGLYGSVEEQEVRIESIANKLQAAVDVQDFQGAAQLKEALETCRAHLDQTHGAIELEAQRAQDEAKRARDEARRARLAARGGNPLPSRSAANASSRSKFVRGYATVRVPWSCLSPARVPVASLTDPTASTFARVPSPLNPNPITYGYFPLGGDGRRDGRAMGGAARAGDPGRRHRHIHRRGPRLALGSAERAEYGSEYDSAEAQSRSGYRRRAKDQRVLSGP